MQDSRSVAILTPSFNKISSLGQPPYKKEYSVNGNITKIVTFLYLKDSILHEAGQQSVTY